VYSGPKIGEPRVNDKSTRDFDGGRALEETVLWLLLAGQDFNDGNYTYTTANSENGKSAVVYNGDSSAECIIQVPGIGISQTDPRNQEALMFCHSILHDLPDGALPVHSRESIFKGGKYSPLLKPSNFLKRPLKWGGWPSPKEGISSLITIDDSDEGESDGEGKEEGDEENEDQEEEEPVTGSKPGKKLSKVEEDQDGEITDEEINQLLKEQEQYETKQPKNVFFDVDSIRNENGQDQDVNLQSMN
jgi:hypothetical protein